MIEQDVFGSSQDDDVAVKSINVAPFINRAKIRKYILEYCGQSPKSYVRKHMKRISSQVYIDLNTQVEQWMKHRVDGQPSMGKTVM
jgi:hypothetical protein